MTFKTVWTNYSVWTVIVFFSLLRLFTAPFFELGCDEAHYVLYAKHLALSYFDHPPLVGWLHVPLRLISDTNEFTARVPAIVIGACTSFFAYKTVLEITNDTKAAFWGAVALNSSFIIDALFLMLLPDTILVLLLYAVIFAYLRLLKYNSFSAYIIFGITLGLCGLAKYTAIVFVFGILFHLIATKKIFELNFKYAFVSILFALVTILPVIVWNIDNNFSSFQYQSSHVAQGEEFSFLYLAKNLTVQLAAYSPPLFVIAFYGLAKTFKEYKNPLGILFWLGVSILIFFSATSMLKLSLPHWISPFFALFIPIGVGVLYMSGKHNIVKYSVIFSLLITLFVHLELVFKFNSFALFRDIYGWKKASMMAKNLKVPNERLAVLDWTRASRLAFYAGEDIFLAENKKTQFAFWYTENPIGKDFLFVQINSSSHRVAKEAICDELTPIGRYDVVLNDETIDNYEYFRCKNFKGIK
jgi:4-amino-4-deoxy-L-arabinose transferase-like glycosyltransferase